MSGMPGKQLILGSQSPRRRELLTGLGVKFSVVVADIDETPVAGESPADCVLRLASVKADAVWRRTGASSDSAVLAADTIVVIDGDILGKPENREHAVAMLSRLSGREHQVMTALALRSATTEESLLQTSKVRFAKLTAREIADYVATGEPDDKAGGYAIQGLAAAFVVSLTGSYSGVVGLPLYETRQLLKKNGIQTRL